MQSIYKLIIFHPSARSLTGRLIKSEGEIPGGEKVAQDAELSMRLMKHQGPWRSEEPKPADALLVRLTQGADYQPLSEILKSNYQLNQPPYVKLKAALQNLEIRPPYHLNWQKFFLLVNEWQRLEGMRIEFARMHRFNEVFLDPIEELKASDDPEEFLIESKRNRLGEWELTFRDPKTGEQDAKTQFSQCFAWRPAKKQLVMYPFKEAFEDLMSAETANQLGLSRSDGNDGPKVILQTEELVQRVLDAEDRWGSELKKALRVSFSFEQKNLTSLSELSLDITQRSGERKLQFSVVIEGEKHPLELPSPFKGLIANGLAWFEGLDRKDVASKGANRTADMSLLRHSGFLVGYLAELLSYLIEEKTLDGQPLKNHKAYQAKLDRDLDDFLRTRMGQKSHAPMVSQKVKKFLSERVPEIIEANQFKSFMAVIESAEGEPRHILRVPQKLMLEMAFLELRSYLLRAPLKELEKTRSRWWEPLWSFQLEKDPNDKPVNPRWTAILTASLWDWVGELNDRGVEIRFNQQKLQTLGEGDIDAKLTLRSFSSADWFELKPDVFFNGRAIDLNQVSMVPGERIMEYQGQLYCFDRRTLPKLETLGSFWKKVLQAQEGRATRLEQNFYTAPKNMTLELLQLTRRGVKVEGDSDWEKTKAYFDQMGQHSHSIPEAVQEVLLPHQAQAFQWIRDLYFLKMGGLLADEMGLGKTLSSLCLLESLRIEGRLGRNMVVVPTSLMFNWKSEATRFVPDLPFYEFSKERGTWPEQGVMIVSYGLLSEHAEMLANHQWNVVIFDEAHFLKNIRTARSQAARKLPAQMRLSLTGTPIENNLEELFSVMDLILPGCLGAHRQFNQKITAFAEDLSSESYKTWIQSLRDLLEPVILRRTKKDTKLKLPEKREFLSPLDMDEDQKRIYKNMAIAMNDQVKSLIGTGLEEGKSVNASLSMLLSLLRLRQICTDPKLVDPSYRGIAPKFKALIDEVEFVCSNGDSSLVFVQFLHSMSRIVTELTQRKINCLTLSGSTSRKDREKILGEFQASEVPTVLVMTLKTGGVGLNLTKANHVFHFEPWWNPAAENQATDRVHRMGQNREVLVRRFIMKDTIEERMQSLKEFKTAQFASLFGGEDGGVDSFKSFKLDPQLFEQLLS